MRGLEPTESSMLALCPQASDLDFTHLLRAPACVMTVAVAIRFYWDSISTRVTPSGVQEEQGAQFSRRRLAMRGDAGFSYPAVSRSAGPPCAQQLIDPCCHSRDEPGTMTDFASPRTRSRRSIGDNRRLPFDRTIVATSTEKVADFRRLAPPRLCRRVAAMKMRAARIGAR